MTYYLISVIISFVVLGLAFLWARKYDRDDTSLGDLTTLIVAMLIPFINVGLAVFVIYGVITASIARLTED